MKDGMKKYWLHRRGRKGRGGGGVFLNWISQEVQDSEREREGQIKNYEQKRPCQECAGSGFVQKRTANLTMLFLGGVCFKRLTLG